MISTLNRVEKGRAVGRVAVPDTLIGVSGWHSTSTTEGLFLPRACLGTLGGSGPFDTAPDRASLLEAGFRYGRGECNALDWAGAY